MSSFIYSYSKISSFSYAPSRSMVMTLRYPSAASRIPFSSSRWVPCTTKGGMYSILQRVTVCSNGASNSLIEYRFLPSGRYASLLPPVEIADMAVEPGMRPGFAAVFRSSADPALDFTTVTLHLESGRQAFGDRRRQNRALVDWIRGWLAAGGDPASAVGAYARRQVPGRLRGHHGSLPRAGEPAAVRGHRGGS